jgi:uncharacterized membrane protein YciS (DUF1049 family)
MKELKDGELIDLANDEIKKMDVHIWSSIIVSCLIVVESLFLILNMVPIFFYVTLWVIFMVLYFVHRIKIKKSEKKIEEIMNELTSREP